jgi:pimeloyl-ACP methyl ester carboxylesterase
VLDALEKRRLKSFDGTELCYYTGGSGPAVVLANGLGGPVASYRHVLAELGSDYKILSWDYRGLYGSGRPPLAGSLGMDHHIRDMEVLMAAEGIDKAIVVGWSMGVQVGFEFYRRHPDQVAGMVMLCGVAGAPFSTVPGGRLAGSLIPPLMHLGKRNARAVEGLSRWAGKWQGLVPLLQRVGMVAPSLDMDVFRDIVRDFTAMDMEVYCETLRLLGTHDASDVPPSVRVPTLLIAGDRDLMTPRMVTERIHAEIDGSRLVVVAGGTHYTPVEFPREVRAELDAFLRTVAGYEPTSIRLGAARA